MRIGLLAQSIRLGVAGGLLLMGGGLLSVPMAALVSSFVQRWLSRRHCLAFLSTQPVSRPERTETIALVKVLWPNSWRVGVYLLSGYLTINANTFLCLKFLGLAANAQYGLSIQIMNILQGMASVWIAVKWPLIGQFVARHDYEGVCAVFRPRLALHLLTFVMMSAVVLPLAPPLLRWLGTDKTILPWHWMLLLAGNALLELNYRTWTTLISLTNRLPFLWFSVAGNVLSLALALGLIRFTPLGMGALVLSPLISGGAFNYWLWPAKGARLFQSSLLRFRLLRSEPPRPIASAPGGATDIKKGTGSC
jgi:Na+-driven multidrug efflux pump